MRDDFTATEVEGAKRDLYLAFYFPDNDSFTANLYRLMRKADQFNFYKLVTAFPLQGFVYIQWFESGDERRFFKEFLPQPAETPAEIKVEKV